MGWRIVSIPWIQELLPFHSFLLKKEEFTRNWTSITSQKYETGLVEREHVENSISSAFQPKPLYPHAHFQTEVSSYQSKVGGFLNKSRQSVPAIFMAGAIRLKYANFPSRRASHFPDIHGPLT